MAEKTPTCDKDNYMSYKKILKTVIFAQCFGLISFMLFMNGFMLEFFTKLEICNSLALFFISIPSWTGLLLSLPAAYYSDRFSKKKIGNIGHFFMIVGFLFLSCIPFFDKNLIIVLS